ncbi:hypothetical protein B7P43_G01938 [Cryptotermes secundus]|uniref:EF-hand domain-containing protein n=1 Tax=Cryptotermes secundus TaxID=105785 RepID=A0A2J7QLQ3_9NEOP|nr:hypothetical protein B7P43_G01938 [Cryptotermes secundus]
MADNLEQQSELFGGSEDASSMCDEERVRKLFQACDGDGDGYIDSQDLLTVCRELNLEDSLEELMRELGADEQGRISYQEFLRRRLALRPEIDALRGGDSAGTQVHCRGTPEYLPTSSDNSLDSHNILNRWRNYFSHLLNAHRVSDVRQSEIHTAEPLVPDPSPLVVESAIAKFKRYKSPSSDQIPAERIQAGGEILSSKIHKLITSLWHKEKLPDQWKESIIVPVRKKGAASGGGKLHESWEFDSGARDLSPEPHTLQKLVEAAGGSLLTSGATGNMLDLANKPRLGQKCSSRVEDQGYATRAVALSENSDQYRAMVE